MARKKKESGSGAPPASVDLFEALTPPGRESPYEFELAAPPVKKSWTETFLAWAQADAAPAAAAPAVDEPEPALPEAAFNTCSYVNDAGTSETRPEQMAEADTFEAIERDIAACKRCSLWKSRTQTVPGEGNPHAKLIFIGEAPGADEDATGRPFVGRAGQHLDKILTAAGFRREEVFIGNILKCRPPDNRTPTLEEMKCCTPFLRRQLALIKPQLIGLLGNTSCKYVLGPDVGGITRIRGQWFESIFGIPCMPMYHPSYLLRNQSRERGSPNWEMWQDIQALKRRYDELV